MREICQGLAGNPSITGNKKIKSTKLELAFPRHTILDIHCKKKIVANIVNILILC